MGIGIGRADREMRGKGYCRGDRENREMRGKGYCRGDRENREGEMRLAHG